MSGVRDSKLAIEAAHASEAIDLREEWRGMQRRIVDLIQGDEKSDLGEHPLELDPSVYTDPERFEAERREIFLREPMLVALSNELAEPGDRVLFDGAGPPILVVRGADRTLRAFLNMCTHRGARLVSSCDRSKRLVCPFHGWAFDLEGRLAGMPLARIIHEGP
ncbi:MAG: Rieske (2Fe-2S) protein [Deltaproteobacteria bacterium]|nr:Rieske (2Fe-2S) protein [Deltaproteobacteria bacterium]